MIDSKKIVFSFGFFLVTSNVSAMEQVVAAGQIAEAADQIATVAEKHNLGKIVTKSLDAATSVVPDLVGKSANVSFDIMERNLRWQRMEIDERNLRLRDEESVFVAFVESQWDQPRNKIGTPNPCNVEAKRLRKIYGDAVVPRLLAVAAKNIEEKRLERAYLQHKGIVQAGAEHANYQELRNRFVLSYGLPAFVKFMKRVQKEESQFNRLSPDGDQGHPRKKQRRR